MNPGRKFKRRPIPYGGKKIQVNFAPIIVIICLSICAGYLTARYVVYPILGYEPAGLNIFRETDAGDKKKETARQQQETTAQIQTTAPAPTTAAPTSVVQDQVDVAKATGYALQFGSYTTKAAAEKSVNQLKSSGVKAEIIEKDGAFKVIGPLFDTKEKAKEALQKMDESVGAFVTTVQR